MQQETLHILRTTTSHPDFRTLVVELDTELRIRDGEDHVFYQQFNSLDKIRHAIVAYEDNNPVGCGALKEFNAETMEVKRMYVKEAQRNKGIASQVLAELETWARELNYRRCILETGYNQPEAIRLYEKNGYTRISNYLQYIGMENSVCFEKVLNHFSDYTEMKAL